MIKSLIILTLTAFVYGEGPYSGNNWRPQPSFDLPQRQNYAFNTQPPQSQYLPPRQEPAGNFNQNNYQIRSEYYGTPNNYNTNLDHYYNRQTFNSQPQNFRQNNYHQQQQQQQQQQKNIPNTFAQQQQQHTTNDGFDQQSNNQFIQFAAANEPSAQNMQRFDARKTNENSGQKRFNQAQPSFNIPEQSKNKDLPQQYAPEVLQVHNGPTTEKPINVEKQDDADSTKTNKEDDADESVESAQFKLPLATKETSSQYYLLLPDGRLQRVVYMTTPNSNDKTGYTANLMYEIVKPLEGPIFTYNDNPLLRVN